MAKGFAAAVFLLFLLLPVRLNAESEKPIFILRDAIWNLNQFGTYQDYWNFLEREGYGGIDIELLDDQGGFYFFSASLIIERWIQQEDYLSDFLRDLENPENPFYNRKNFRVSLNFTQLSRRMREDWKGKKGDKLSHKQMGEFAYDLKNHYDPDDLTSEPFDEGYEKALFISLEEDQRSFNMIGKSPWFESFFYAAAYSDRDLVMRPERLISFDTALYPTQGQKVMPSIGLGDVVLSLGRTLGQDVWASCVSGQGLDPYSEHNLFLYRTIQYAPDAFLVVPNSENAYVFDPELFSLKKNITESVKKYYIPYESRAKKPVANLVLGAKRDTEVRLPVFIEPIINALHSNGYEIRVTFGKLLKRVDLYYVVNSEEWLYDDAFFKKLVRLLHHRKSRFYGTVILHPQEEIIDRSKWKEVRAFFKIPSTETGWIKDLPSTINLKERKVSWKGSVESENYGMTNLRAERIHDFLGEVVLSEIYEGESIALILKAENHYLVNSNFLHLEAAYFLSELVGGALQAPVLAYVTAGKDRTVALGVEETELELKVPTPVIPENWRITLYDPKGNLSWTEVVKGEEIFKIGLNPMELVVLEADHP